MNIDKSIERRSDEHLVFALRSHWLLYVGDLTMIATLAVVPAGAFLALVSVWPNILLGAVTGPALILFGSAYYLVIWLFFITTFVDYYLDAWVITSSRIINIEQRGLFSRIVSELDLIKIQDVTSEVKGVLPSILNYGDVFIQTAGETTRFVFHKVPRPHEVRKQILEMVSADRRQELGAAKLEEL